MGRFAPSPTGELHLGSLYAAVASYLDARSHGGKWLLRIEDIDKPREIRGATDAIIRTLESFGFEWDGAIMRQSARADAYAAALETLGTRGLVFECSCSRAQLAEEERYPGNCRERPLLPQAALALRLRVDPGFVQFEDRLQGIYRQEVAAAAGDLILKRRDGLFAYLLAVVVDDAAQGVTHVVRGADLLDNTPRQIHLQRALGLPTPAYAHIPVLVEASGAKLAKSARSVGLEPSRPLPQLFAVFKLLGLQPPLELRQSSRDELWSWAMTNWHIKGVFRRLTLPLEAENHSF